MVALYMSAWIEIFLLRVESNQEIVALYMSAWIEIRMGFPTLTSGLVALYMSAWIEIVSIIYQYPPFYCRTLHECVD